jgi:8-oxo-dGTP diphosphatase
VIRYAGQTRALVAVDCIIFGFDGDNFKLLLIQRGFAPEKKKWSLMGGFVQLNESLDQAANRVLHQLTGLENVFMEQLHTFGDPLRDPAERTIAVAYVALIDIQKYEQQLSQDFHAKWFLLNDMPQLIFDHEKMVQMAKSRLKYKAAMHPILFELLPEKFTVPQLQTLYEGLYETEFDKRNFFRKVLSTGFLIKQDEKDKGNSRKGAFYYKIDKEQYNHKFEAFLNLIPKQEAVLI